jgi:hypothetical protein
MYYIKGKIITMIKYYIYKAEYNNNIGWYLYNIGYTTSVW